MVQKIEIICQRWHDSDQSAGKSLHLTMRDWLNYKNKRVEETQNNHYPFVPSGEPFFVYVNANVQRRLERQGTIMYPYSSINEQSRNVILEVLEK